MSISTRFLFGRRGNTFFWYACPHKFIAQEHMKQRPGGTVHVEIIFVSEFLKRDARDDREFDDI
jgi:hypothetical protein